MMSIGNDFTNLKAVDNVCDYIPIVSTFSNITDLFIKAVILPNMDNADIKKSSYYSHIQKKDTARCIVLLIPLIGNLALGLLDYCKYLENFETVIEKDIKNHGPFSLKFASERLKNDKTFILKILATYPKCLEFVGQELFKDEEFALKAGEILETRQKQELSSLQEKHASETGALKQRIREAAETKDSANV